MRGVTTRQGSPQSPIALGSLISCKKFARIENPQYSRHARQMRVQRTHRSQWFARCLGSRHGQAPDLIPAVKEDSHGRGFEEERSLRLPRRIAFEGFLLERLANAVIEPTAPAKSRRSRKVPWCLFSHAQQEPRFMTQRRLWGMTGAPPDHLDAPKRPQCG